LNNGVLGPGERRGEAYLAESGGAAAYLAARSGEAAAYMAERRRRAGREQLRVGVGGEAWVGRLERGGWY
jgi:hypothetical protein